MWWLAAVTSNRKRNLPPFILRMTQRYQPRPDNLEESTDIIFFCSLVEKLDHFYIGKIVGISDARFKGQDTNPLP